MATMATERRVRAALAKAGHGAVATDAHGGDGLIGYHTFRCPDSVLVGFDAQLGQGFRIGYDTLERITPAMLTTYARTLRDAGFCVTEEDGILRVRV
jgi:hypothetical protein